MHHGVGEPLFQKDLWDHKPGGIVLHSAKHYTFLLQIQSLDSAIKVKMGGKENSLPPKIFQKGLACDAA